MNTIRIWFESAFDIAYLLTIWYLVVTMARRLNTVAEKNRRVALLVTIAFGLLALGDTGHVGLRVMTYLLGNSPATARILGMGTLTTAVTVTLFYVLLIAIWRYRFEREYGPFEYLMFIAALTRLIMLAAPANHWDSPVPPQPWSTIRNLPLLVQGLIAFSFLRDGRRYNDPPFWWIGTMILLSFACYMTVVLLVQKLPLIGLLMIPKTVAYIVMAILAYKTLYGGLDEHTA